jgi:hypothetical protein
MLQVLFGLVFFAWIALSLLWLSTFTQVGRTPWGKRGYRYRRVRWSSAIAATATFILACVVAQGLPTSREQETGKPPTAVTTSPDAAPTNAGAVASAQAPDLSRPVTDAQEDAGENALCTAVMEKLKEAVRSGKTDEDTTTAQAELLIVADTALAKELGVSDWRANKIIGVSLDRMKNHDSSGNLLTYCVNRSGGTNSAGSDAGASMPPNPDLKVSAPELAREYGANSVAADLKFKGKLIEVDGEIEDISRDVTNTIFVVLSSQDPESVTDIQLFFSDAHEKEAASLNKGEYFAAVCQCEGKFVNVLLKNCETTISVSH